MPIDRRHFLSLVGAAAAARRAFNRMGSWLSVSSHSRDRALSCRGAQRHDCTPLYVKAFRAMAPAHLHRKYSGRCRECRDGSSGPSASRWIFPGCRHFQLRDQSEPVSENCIRSDQGFRARHDDRRRAACSGRASLVSRTRCKGVCPAATGKYR